MRLIDAEELERKIIAETRNTPKGEMFEKGFRKGLDFAQYLIDRASTFTVQEKEHERCEECKGFQAFSCDHNMGYCKLLATRMGKKDYCSYWKDVNK